MLTPVRRSARTETRAPEATRALLATTDYAFVPNPVLPQLPAPAQPPVATPAAWRDPVAVAAAVVALAKEAFDPEPEGAPAPQPEVRRSRRAQAGKR